MIYLFFERNYLLHDESLVAVFRLSMVFPILSQGLLINKVLLDKVVSTNLGIRFLRNKFLICWCDITKQVVIRTLKMKVAGSVLKSIVTENIFLFSVCKP